MDTEDLALRTVARDFTRHVVNPAFKKYDGQPRAGFPSEAIIQAQQIGLPVVAACEEWGGCGSFYQAGIVIEELAACCPGFAAILAASLWSIAPLVLSTDQSKAKQLFDRYFTQGQSVRLAASILPDTGRPGNIQAKPEGEDYILNGQALCVLNAGVSVVYLVFANVRDSLICGTVSASTQGILTSEPIRKLGLNVTPYADVTF